MSDPTLVSGTTLLEGLLVHLETGELPPPEKIAAARAHVDRSKKARADMKAALEPIPDEQIKAELLAGRVHIKLTLPQWNELSAMATNPQRHEGWRINVQNRLVTMFAAEPHRGPAGTTVSITDVGRKILADNTHEGKYRRWGG